MYALTLTSLIFDELISMGGCVESLIYILSYLHTKHLVKTGANPTIATFTYILFFKKKEVAWGGERTQVLSISFIVLFTTTLPLSHSGSPHLHTFNYVGSTHYWR
jgi:hypothetical protein